MKQECRDDAQLRKKIMLIIDHELSKQNPDMKMIEAYSAVLNEMDHSAQQLDPEEREEAIKNLKRACQDMTDNKVIYSAQPVRRRRMVRKTVTVLCTILVVFGLMLGTVCAIGGVSPITVLENIGHAIFGWEVGEPVEIEGLTFIRNGEPKQYDSIEQCLREEGLDICYPTWLPDGIRVESVLVLSNDENDRVVYRLNSDSITINVNLSEKIEDIKSLDYTELSINDQLQIYYKYNENMNSAKFDIAGIVYTMTADSIQVVEKIALNMRRD